MIPDKVIVHCSATPDYEISSKRYDIIGAHEIDIMHKQRGFTKIGYHWVIRRTGIIEPGRVDGAVFEIGAHCKGLNTRSIGICYIGIYKPTDDQLISLRLLFSDISKRRGIDIKEWYTHNYFNHHKTCPGFSMKDLKNILYTIDFV